MIYESKCLKRLKTANNYFSTDKFNEPLVRAHTHLLFNPINKNSATCSGCRYLTTTSFSPSAQAELVYSAWKTEDNNWPFFLILNVAFERFLSHGCLTEYLWGKKECHRCQPQLTQHNSWACTAHPLLYELYPKATRFTCVA